MRALLLITMALAAVVRAEAYPAADAWTAYEKGDYARALELVRPEASKGEPNAQQVLAEMYFHGRGVPKDLKKAFELRMKSAEQGNMYAQSGLGNLHFNGTGAPKDYVESAKWYRKAAEQGEPGAQHMLGHQYWNGFGVKQDWKLAFDWLLKSAEQGNQYAQGGVGYLYQQGLGAPKDYAKAVAWYRKSAAQGNEHAEAGLGAHYEYGWGVKKDLAEARAWYLKAANKGLPQAQTNLGNLHFNGTGVPKDYVESAKWYRKAAEQGEPGAQHMLGWQYWNGWAVKQDWKLAFDWMMKSAVQGNQFAQSGVGYLLHQGLGTEKDHAAALEWYRKAVAAGERTHAAFHLGEMHEAGLGVAQDFVEAYKWYAVSAAQDLDVARQAMDRLRKEMTKEQVAEAQKAARGDRPQAPSPAPMPAPAAAPEKTYSSGVDQPAYRFAENADLFALVIGVDRYKDLPRAEFAERDAAAVKEHLRALGFPERNIVTLTGADATISGMRKYVEEWLPRNIREGSRLFVYFSGHGAPDPSTGEAYLVPWDGDASFLKSTAYPVAKLYASLRGLPAESVWVALDACFSGAGGRSVLADGARPLVLKTADQTPDDPRLAVLSAAAGDEITGTLKAEGHGIFTYYLLEGMSRQAARGKGRLDLADVHDYLKPKVRDAARRQNRDQTPSLRGGNKRAAIPLIKE
ncbi:MAG: caspase family protein [Elusimicrobiota bacterium]